MTIEKKPRGRPPKAKADDVSSRIADLESKYASALATIQQLSHNNAALASQFGGAMRAPVMSGQLVVGIRNVSNYTIGLSDTTAGREISYSLHPEIEGVADPKSRAVVSYVFWQQLRVGEHVGRGMIIRDDSIIGPADNAAPEDRPEDIHPDHWKNTVINPRQWILSQTEDELRERVAVMTSEQTLRRLIEAVDTEVWNIGEGKYKDDPDKPRKAVRDLPAAFRLAEELFYERLDELNPMSKQRDQETATPRRYARV